jgi:uncharacterized protein (DUF58 family)
VASGGAPGAAPHPTPGPIPATGPTGGSRAASHPGGGEPLDLRQYLDPKVLARLGRLELKARLIVEGFISGLHRSPYHGFSVEFAEHREYVPGDDIRHVDWKVFGRTDRFYIKQYEEETNLKCYILLDGSESMHYGAEETTKYRYGTYVAAALSHLILRQQDAVGLAVFDQEVRGFVPPSSSQNHLRNIIQELDRQGTGRKTDIGMILKSFADRIKRKGLIVIISDMFDSLEHIDRGLKHLRHKRHEVVLFHVLDRDELTFPFQRMTLFEGLEGFPELLADPRALRKAYLEEMGRFQDSLRKICRQSRVDYVLLDTSRRLDAALTAYLAARGGRPRRA